MSGSPSRAAAYNRRHVYAWTVVDMKNDWRSSIRSRKSKSRE